MTISITLNGEPRSVAPGIEQHRLRPARVRFMQPVDEMPLMVRLAHINAQAKRLRLILKPPSNVIKRIMPVNLRLSDAQQIKVWPVEHIDDWQISHKGFLSVAASRSPSLYGLRNKSAKLTRFD